MTTTENIWTARVTEVVPVAEGVRLLCLADPAGDELPEWTPGAHVDLILPSGLVRQYSLCGDPKDRHTYRIAVLREDEGRGGSREIHDSLLVGRDVKVRGPRNHFPLINAPRYLFIAGGIGITPILAMVREVSGREVPWRLIYGGRTRATMAFVDELCALRGNRVELVSQEEQGLLPLDDILGSAGEDTTVYCCGPEQMIRAVEEKCASYLPSGALHVERFSASSASKSAASDRVDTDTFEVELARNGAVLAVPPDRTILDVVREAELSVLYSCEEGWCGTCEVRVLDGTPDHRDEVLTDEEKVESRTMMICISRSCSARLVLDL